MKLALIIGHSLWLIPILEAWEWPMPKICWDSGIGLCWVLSELPKFSGKAKNNATLRLPTWNSQLDEPFKLKVLMTFPWIFGKQFITLVTKVSTGLSKPSSLSIDQSIKPQSDRGALSLSLSLSGSSADHNKVLIRPRLLNRFFEQWRLLI